MAMTTKPSIPDPNMPSQQLRLHMGEMTAQEERTARAAIRWANSAMGEVVGAERTARVKADRDALIEKLEKIRDYAPPEDWMGMMTAIAVVRQHQAEQVVGDASTRKDADSISAVITSPTNYAGGVSETHVSEPSDSGDQAPDGRVMGVLPTPAPDDSSKYGYGEPCHGFPCGCAGCNSVGRSESSVTGDAVSLAATLTLTRPRYTSNQSEICDNSLRRAAQNVVDTFKIGRDLVEKDRVPSVISNAIATTALHELEQALRQTGPTKPVSGSDKAAKIFREGLSRFQREFWDSYYFPPQGQFNIAEMQRLDGIIINALVEGDEA